MCRALPKGDFTFIRPRSIEPFLLTLSSSNSCQTVLCLSRWDWIHRGLWVPPSASRKSCMALWLETQWSCSFAASSCDLAARRASWSLPWLSEKRAGVAEAHTEADATQLVSRLSLVCATDCTAFLLLASYLSAALCASGCSSISFSFRFVACSLLKHLLSAYFSLDSAWHLAAVRWPFCSLPPSGEAESWAVGIVHRHREKEAKTPKKEKASKRRKKRKADVFENRCSTGCQIFLCTKQIEKNFGRKNWLLAAKPFHVPNTESLDLCNEEGISWTQTNCLDWGLTITE